MIRSIEALRYRCLRDVGRELDPFLVLVGPNASGKSTFLDVVALLGDLLNRGPKETIQKRSPNLFDLIWMGESDSFELAVELEIPSGRRERLPQNGTRRARYEVAVGLDGKGELAILGETLWLRGTRPARPSPQISLFPNPPRPRRHLVYPEGKKAPQGWKKVLAKKPESGNDYFFSETTGWNNPFRLGPQKLALANLPEDEERFPVATWVKRVLMEGVQLLVLNSEAMRRPAPPGSPVEFQPDGSNLPLVVEELRKREAFFDRWLDHVRTALPQIREVETVVREEDKHRYLLLHFDNGLEAKSWNLSDSTLRLLALTLVAYVAEAGRIYLIEEPENGIHPQAVETVFQSLSSAYDSQILCASHSPVFLSLAQPDQLLCFAQAADGATDIVLGSDHPNLRDWRRSTDLGTLFATGLLG